MMGDDGKPYIATDQYGHKMYDYGTLTGPYGIVRGFSQSGNPLGSNIYNKNEQGLNQINGTFTADVTFTPATMATRPTYRIWHYKNSCLSGNGYKTTE